MIVATLFWLLTFACCAIGARFGGNAGRWTATIYILGCLATLVAFEALPYYGRVHLGTLIADLAVLVALLAVALASRRWFPLWMCGFHLVGISSHFASMFVPHFAAKVYFVLQGFWGVPMLLVFAAGAVRDWQNGIRDDRQPRSSPQDATG